MITIAALRVLYALATAVTAAHATLDRYGQEALGRGRYKDTVERITELGYPAERHRTTTDDGYILTMFRIPRSPLPQGNVTRSPRPIVFVQHGLFGSSDDWLATGANASLPMLLADAGFDVWLGNTRGNYYSRAHTHLSAQSRTFWRFSWDEMGRYDLPAMIDYALAVDGGQQRSLHYVGHSQGTTALLVALAERPLYGARIRTAQLLAPVAFLQRATLRFLVSVAPILGHHNPISVSLSSREFLPHNDDFLALIYTSCALDAHLLQLCTHLRLSLEGSGTWKNLTAVQVAAGTRPAGSSTDQVLHYMQEQQSGHFRRFDFGHAANLQLYGQPQPPDYALERIDARLHLWYGENDELAAVGDVQRLAALLPNRVLHRISDPAWGHFDFLHAAQLRRHLNDPLVALLQEHEQRDRQLPEGGPDI